MKKTADTLAGDEAIAGARRCAALLAEKKASDIIVLDLRRVNSYLDCFVIATGTSHLHCRALARELERHAAAAGIKQRNRPDLDSGWVIIDLNDIIIHLFTEEIRAYYQLEKLWGDAERVAW